jgi:riboflavin kinase/FMN adenylyltransferase
MKVVFSKANIPLEISQGTAIALGNFDGLHIGHMELINRTINAGNNSNLKSIVYTFSNHPENVIAGKFITPLITPNETKAEILSRHGVDYLYLEEFNQEYMKIAPEDFVKDILLKRFNVKHVTVGFHYRFGYKSAGTPETLKQMGQKYGFDVEVVAPVKLGDIIVSSSLIRRLIANGDVEHAAEFMKRYYQVTGKIVRGKHLGREIGFPTINIVPGDDRVLPSKGVYVTSTDISGCTYCSVTNVGVNPTVNDQGIRIETHILDFTGDLYDSTVTVHFIKKIRDEKKFTGLAQLTEQIRKDVRYTKQYFSAAMKIKKSSG